MGPRGRARPGTTTTTSRPTTSPARSSSSVASTVFPLTPSTARWPDSPDWKQRNPRAETDPGRRDPAPLDHQLAAESTAQLLSEPARRGRRPAPSSLLRRPGEPVRTVPRPGHRGRTCHGSICADRRRSDVSAKGWQGCRGGSSRSWSVARSTIRRVPQIASPSTFQAPGGVGSKRATRLPHVRRELHGTAVKSSSTCRSQNRGQADSGWHWPVRVQQGAER